MKVVVHMATAARLQRFKCVCELISLHCHLLWPLWEAGQNSFQLPCKMCPYGSGQALSALHTFWVQSLFSTTLLQMSVCVPVELHSVSLVSVSWWCVCVLFMMFFFELSASSVSARLWHLYSKPVINSLLMELMESACCRSQCQLWVILDILR